MRVLAVISLVLMLLAGCDLVGSGVDRDGYVARNRAILDQLPRFPGSIERDEGSTPYRAEESGPIVGYGTRVVLELPPGSRVDEVVSYFRTHLGHRWRLVERLDGPVVNYRSGDASASLNFDNWTVHAMEIAVDHAFYANRHF